MLRKSLVLTLVLAFASALHAQVGVYGTFDVSRLSGFSSTATGVGTLRNAVDVTGGTAGVFYDFKTVGPVRLGADLRGSVASSTRSAYVNYVNAGSHLRSVLGGVRGVFHTPFPSLRPYLQASAGLGSSDYGMLRDASGRFQLDNNFEYHAFAGVDINILPFADFRAVEVGYGGLVGSGSNYPLRSVSTGIVFHLPFTD